MPHINIYPAPSQRPPACTAQPHLTQNTMLNNACNSTSSVPPTWPNITNKGGPLISPPTQPKSAPPCPRTRCLNPMELPKLKPKGNCPKLKPKGPALPNLSATNLAKPNITNKGETLNITTCQAKRLTALAKDALLKPKRAGQNQTQKIYPSSNPRNLPCPKFALLKPKKAAQAQTPKELPKLNPRDLPCPKFALLKPKRAAQAQAQSNCPSSIQKRCPNSKPRALPKLKPKGTS